MDANIISENSQSKFQNELDRWIKKGYKIQGQLVVTPWKEREGFASDMADVIRYSIIVVSE